MKPDRIVRLLLGIVAIMAVLAGPAAAQTNTGTVTGRVFDTSAALVPGASVVLKGVATNVPRETVSNEAGVYVFSSVPPGPYLLTVELAGFKTRIVDSVEVLTAQTTTVDVTLEVGSASETVTVSAETPLLARDSSAVVSTVEKDLVQTLPYTEVSALGAVMIAPGVTGDPQYQGGVQSEVPGVFTQPVMPGGSLSMGGGRPGTGSILVDGSDISLAGYARPGVTLSGETLQEVSVQVTGVPAQYGRTGGGIVNQTSRSGSNAFHGSVGWRFTRPELQAWTHGQREVAAAAGPKSPAGKPNKKYDLYSFNAGGPVVIPKIYDGHNRTFFFATVEPSRFDQPSFWSEARIPTPDELAGRLNNSFDLINQTILRASGPEAALAAPRVGGLYYQFPLNAQGFPVGTRYTSPSLYQAIPGNDLSALLAANPIARQILSYYPTPSNPGAYTVFKRPDGLWTENGNNAYTVRGVQSEDNRFNLRLDHTFGSSDRIAGRYTYVPVIGTRYNFFGPDSPVNNVVQDQIKTRNVMVSYTRTLSSNKLNELRVTYTRAQQFKGPSDVALEKDWGAELGLYPSTAGVGFPAITGLPGGTVGSGGAAGGGGGGRTLDKNLGFADDFSWVIGRHNIKTGGEMRFLGMDRTDATNLYGGQYGFAASFTNDGVTGGSPIASFMLGIVNSYAAKSRELTFKYRWNYYAAYVQDDFKVSPRLTVNMGLRYDVETPRTETENRQGSFDPSVKGTLNGLPVTGGFVFAGETGRGRGLWKTNFAGLQPRLGFSWAVLDSVAVRGTYALMRPGLTGLGSEVIPDLNVPSQSIGTTGGVNIGQVNYVTNPVAALSPPVPLSGGPLFSNFAGIYINPSDKFPTAHQVSLSTQIQLGRRLGVEVAYTYSRGDNLWSSPTEINRPAYATLQQLVAQRADFQSRTIPNPYGLVDQAGQLRLMTLAESLRPYAQFFDNTVTTAYDRQGKSRYHGVYVAAKQRMTDGLVFQGSYAWSHSRDNASSGSFGGQETEIFGIARPQNYDNYDNEWSVSTYDIPNKVTTGATWNIPYGKGNVLLGDWMVSGLFTWQQGYPIWTRLGSVGYWVSLGGGNALQGNAANVLRPNLVPGVPLINPDWSRSGDVYNTPYLNPAAFTVPGALNQAAFGDAPRTLADARNPDTWFFDLTLSKRLKVFGKGRYLEVRADAINALNHANFYINPNNGHNLVGAFQSASITNPATPPFVLQGNFGKFDRNNTTPGRLLRFGLKFGF